MEMRRNGPVGSKPWCCCWWWWWWWWWSIFDLAH